MKRFENSDWLVLNSLIYKIYTTRDFELMRSEFLEQLRLVLDFGFYKLKLNRIEAQHEVDNPASGAVMRKAGMAHEGILRQRLCNKGRFVDVALYAALRSEYVQ